MSEKQWVCHISGQGEKWEVLTYHVAAWQVMSPLSGATFMLPKSEYRLCDPPEVWRDVTERIVPVPGRNAWKDQDGNWVVMEVENGYRLKKVDMNIHSSSCEEFVRSAFIVEQRVPQ